MPDADPSSSPDKMKRWRNVICPESEPDAEIRAIDAFEDRVDAADKASADHVRALISRIDPLSHYKIFDNIDFILEAIGKLDYPRSPAVDVLWRHGQIDPERRAFAKCYVRALEAWLEDKELAAATGTDAGCAEVTTAVYRALGDRTAAKRWLAMSLRKTLKEHAYEPWDTIQEHSDAEFVRAVYTSILGRPPSPDDLAFRLRELASGKSRVAFLEEILAAPEHQAGHLACIAEQLKRG